MSRMCKFNNCFSFHILIPRVSSNVILGSRRCQQIEIRRIKGVECFEDVRQIYLTTIDANEKVVMSTIIRNSTSQVHNQIPGGQIVEKSFKPWRVFINHIDSYHGQKLAHFLSECTYVNPQTDTAEGSAIGEEEEIEEIEDEDMDEDEDEKIYREAALEEEGTSRKYEVIGTTLDREFPCPEDVTMIIRDTRDRNNLLNELINCGIVIYDITQNQSQVDEARWALEAIVKVLEEMEEKAPKAFKRSKEVRYFILISTVMTWALSKPLSPEEPDLPLTEADYRKRKPHPNFKEHSQCEKEVVIVKRRKNLSEKLKTLVICCGITYGDEEGLLHYLFKMAWKNTAFLPIFGKGDNKIPLLHVRDLITCVFTILQSWPPLRYILAVEQELPSQAAIVKKISKELGTGKVKNIPKEEAFLLPEITQLTYDVMTVNLNVDPDYITDKITWHFDMPFLDNIAAIVREYKAARKLYPMKIIVVGPPASGKTMVAQYLAKHYDIHYIHVKSVITDTIQKLSNEIEAGMLIDEQEESKNKGGGDEEIEEIDEYAEDEEVTDVEELREQLNEIRRNFERNNGRLDDTILNKLLLKRLQSRECSNQGYVMDGYPKTLEQAKALFGAENSTEEDEYEENEIRYDSIMPELVIALEASDAFLIERIINRPEKEIQHTHYTEEHMLRRLREYRERNTDDNTPLQFFDEMEIQLFIIPIESDACPDMFPTISQCLEKLGKPRNYGLTPEEAIEAQRLAEEKAHAAEEIERLQKEREMQERKREQEEKMMEWTNLTEALKQEEEERLCILGQPLRHYLVRYVFPTLTQGLIEVAKLRPEDPVDFLAEYLFKENPEGKMFKPDYTETITALLNTIEKEQDNIFHRDELDDEMKAFLKTTEKLSSTDTTETVDIDVCTNIRTTPLTSSSSTYDGAERFEQEEYFSADLDNYDEDV